MCGLFGILATNQVLKPAEEREAGITAATTMLRLSQFRGQDAWGLCYVESEMGKTVTSAWCSTDPNNVDYPIKEMRTDAQHNDFMAIVGHARNAGRGPNTLKRTQPFIVCRKIPNGYCHFNLTRALCTLYSGKVDNLNELVKPVGGTRVLPEDFMSFLVAIPNLQQLSSTLSLVRGRLALCITSKTGTLLFRTADEPLFLATANDESYLLFASDAKTILEACSEVGWECRTPKLLPHGVLHNVTVKGA